KAIVYDDTAFEQLVQTVKLHALTDPVQVICDARTFKVAGQRTEATLLSAGVDAKTFIVPDQNGKSPICDETTKNTLNNSLPKTAVMIAVGSGVINDLVKWVSFERNIPYYVMATAASMNGYAAANVAATVNGVKTLMRAHAPLAVFAVPHIIENAPFEMTASGLGDALAKPVSSADWRLNQILFDEYYCQFIVDIVKELEPGYLDHPEGIKSRDPAAIESLFKTLFYSGVAMTLAGTSSPASGGEHLLSHALDMLSLRDHLDHDLHGRQVGIGTILSAALYEKLWAQDTVTLTPLSPHVDAAFWGALTDEVSGHYQQKLKTAATIANRFSNKDAWQKLKQGLTPFLRSPQTIKNCLKIASAAHQINNIGRYSTDAFTRVWQNCHQLRSRFTILDLAHMAGIMPVCACDLIKKWVV
ncbi:MAG: iron-containing alcohol dehydrogenase, partial [Deltaproteobacteria bacterium]|nr:iron-containing alcohol dehydrogenase [Deltaproteobacteria bacterium]